MKRTVLIPTDFSIESLHVVKNVLSNTGGNEELNIILLHGVYLTDSISDLMFFSKSKALKNLSNEIFEDALNVLKNKYASRINSIRKDIFSGYNQAAFDNYVEANRIDEAFISSRYSLEMSSKKSFDIVPYIQNNGIKVTYVATHTETVVPEKGQVAEIFFDGITAN